MDNLGIGDKLRAMREGGKKLRRVRQEIVAKIKPGVKLIDLDQWAERLILNAGGRCAFQKVPGYQWATCININEGVVHGIPSDRVIQDGDLVSVDVGMIYQGWHTDTSTTVVAGSGGGEEKQRLIEVGQWALAQAIEACRLGKHIGHVSAAMETVLRSSGYSPVRTLTGHGVGRELHEFPPIPCFVEGDLQATPVMSQGMTLAVEVIYSAGKPETKILADGWTMVTQDGSLAGLFEETVAVTSKGPEVLT